MALETFEKLPYHKKNQILSTGIRAFSVKPYTEVSTDGITAACQISKGLLFHYFGSKKAFYLYCLEKAMECLTAASPVVSENDFYDILFAAVNSKMDLCIRHPDEMRMVNMASRDGSGEIAREKEAVLRKYRSVMREESLKTLQRALAALPLRERNRDRFTAEGLFLYIHAVLNKYLLQYQQTPDRFFEDRERIKTELKAYLDLMLFGICD